jgi:hypothetical protein
VLATFEDLLVAFLCNGLQNFASFLTWVVVDEWVFANGRSGLSIGRQGKAENPKQTDTVNDDPDESGLFASRDSFVKDIFPAHLTLWALLGCYQKSP